MVVVALPHFCYYYTILSVTVVWKMSQKPESTQPEPDDYLKIPESNTHTITIGDDCIPGDEKFINKILVKLNKKFGNGPTTIAAAAQLPAKFCSNWSIRYSVVIRHIKTNKTRRIQYIRRYVARGTMEYEICGYCVSGDGDADFPV